MTPQSGVVDRVEKLIWRRWDAHCAHYVGGTSMHFECGDLRRCCILRRDQDSDQLHSRVFASFLLTRPLPPQFCLSGYVEQHISSPLSLPYPIHC